MTTRRVPAGVSHFAMTAVAAMAGVTASAITKRVRRGTIATVRVFGRLMIPRAEAIRVVYERRKLVRETGQGDVGDPARPATASLIHGVGPAAAGVSDPNLSASGDPDGGRE